MANPGSSEPTNPADHAAARNSSAHEGRSGFGDDFRRFFVRGLATLLPTLITLWLLVWVWNFLWNSIGQYVILSIEWTWWSLGRQHVVEEQPAGYIRQVFHNAWFTQPLGVILAVLLVYVVGVFVGNLIGRTMWRLMERAVMRLPLVKAIYPAVKQVTDFLLADRNARAGQFQGSRVVAVQARAQGIWSIGLVTGSGYRPLNDAVRGDMMTVFIPSSPTSFSGYVVVAHREAVVELPLTVEEALRLLVSGGVIVPPPRAAGAKATAGGPIIVPALEGAPPEVPAPPAGWAGPGQELRAGAPGPGLAVGRNEAEGR